MFASPQRPLPAASLALRSLTFALIALVVATTALTSAPAPTPAPPPAVPAAADMGRLPLAFVPNAGQAAPEARFAARGMGGELFFTPAALVLALPAKAGGDTVALRFDGALRGAAIVGDAPGEARVHYLRGSNPRSWLTDLHTFGAVIYRGLYHGVDLRFDGSDGQLEGTYTLTPGADPAAIRWRYDGAQSVSVDQATGDLRVRLLSGGELREKAPTAYQVIDGQRSDVHAAFGVGPDGQVGFALGAYNARHALTIDPTLTYSSYLGGNQGASAEAVAVDADGFIYVAGHTRSSDFPLVRGVQAQNNGGSYDAFVSKFTPNGKTLVYSTYLGGGDADYATGIAVDEQGRATVAGFTSSANFPLPPITRSAINSFYLTLNASGSVILNGGLFTIAGASGYTVAEGLARDPNGNLYLGGWTSEGVLQQSDAFVRKITPAGGVAYSKRLGGTGNDRANGVAVDNAGNVALAGRTESADFPLTAPAQNAPGQDTDGFVARLDGSGNPLFSTYLGGEGYDEVLGVASDAGGNLFVTGVTSSTTFLRLNPFQNNFGGSYGDAFVTAYTPAGAPRYSSFLGGSGYERGRAIAVRPDGGAVVVGETDSGNFPLFSPQQGSSGGNTDAFISQLKPDGSALAFSTYLGGSEFDEAQAVAVDASGTIFVAGEALSNNFPTVNPFQGNRRSTNADLGDAFIARYGEPVAPDPIPGNDTGSPPALPSTTRTLGNVTVRASAFTGDPNWTATGTFYIGNAVVVEEGTISASGGALSGSGLVSLITKGQKLRLFRGSFAVNATSGALTPSSLGEWKLNNFAGFRIKGAPQAADVSLDALAGRLNAKLNLDILIPGIGNRISKLLDVKLDAAGVPSGQLKDVVFKLGPLSLKIVGAALDSNGFRITEAELVLPLGLGGNKAGFNAQNVYITSGGQFDLSRNGSLEIAFPNITVGGASGFTIEGPSAKIAVNGDEYVFTGKGTFGLPGVGKGKKSGGGQCGVEVGFSVSNLPPPIRQASLSISGCFSIPIDTTGFFLSGVNGSVELDEGKVSVDLGITITGGPLVPGIGALISGSVAAHWDNSWKVGLSGAIKVLSIDALKVSLELSQRQGLYGRFDVYAALGAIDGYAEFRAWQSSGEFHITGSAGVKVGIPRNAFTKDCSICPAFPREDINIGSVNADFGEFRKDGSSTRYYGLKGSMQVLGTGPYSFFVSSRGELTFIGAGKYNLLPPPGLLAAGPNALGATAQSFTVAPNTPFIMGGMVVRSGSPTLELIAPDNTKYTASTPGVSITNSPTETLLAVQNPQAGTWTLNAAGSVAGNEIYLSAFGGKTPATLAAPTFSLGGDGSYTISYAGSSSTPTSTVSLFVDTSPISRTGVPVAQGLPLSGNFTWKPGRIASGTYYIYAMVDDPLGPAAFAYAATPVTVSDTTPPAVPTGVQLSTAATTTTVTWAHDVPPDIGGYRIYYTEPGGHTSVVDITASDLRSYDLAGLYVNGTWQVQVSAYDISGNESAKSAAATTTVTLPPAPPAPTDGKVIYLPIVVR